MKLDLQIGPMHLLIATKRWYSLGDDKVYEPVIRFAYITLGQPILVLQTNQPRVRTAKDFERAA